MPAPTGEFWRDFAGILNKKAEKRPTGPGWLMIDEIRQKFPDSSLRDIKTALRDPAVKRFRGTRLKNRKLVVAVWYLCR